MLRNYLKTVSGELYCVNYRGISSKGERFSGCEMYNTVGEAMAEFNDRKSVPANTYVDVEYVSHAYGIKQRLNFWQRGAPADQTCEFLVRVTDVNSSVQYVVEDSLDGAIARFRSKEAAYDKARKLSARPGDHRVTVTRKTETTEILYPREWQG